jgi:hypothetical protein
MRDYFISAFAQNVTYRRLDCCAGEVYVDDCGSPKAASMGHHHRNPLLAFAAANRVAAAPPGPGVNRSLRALMPWQPR